ncbi:hypothetical protein Tco_0572600 [Tanacetum coccineum]
MEVSLHDKILHDHQLKSSVKMQSQDIQINPVQAMDDSLIVSKSSLIESENHNAFSKSEIETQMQRQEEKVNMREAVDADIGPVNDEEPFAEERTRSLVYQKTITLRHEFKEFKTDDMLWQMMSVSHQFQARSSSKDVWINRFKPRSLMSNLLASVPKSKEKVYSFKKRKVSLLHDNIVPKPDLALELGKSISLTEAEEEAVAREVHATQCNNKVILVLCLAMKNLDDTYQVGDHFFMTKTEDDQEKSKVIEESDSTIPDPSHQTVTSTPPVIAPFTDVSSTKPSSLVTPPPINTEATTITTSLPEITPFIALQLRVARLEQEMSEVKKTDHSADVLASIKSQVPTVVDKYLGTKLDDALLKILERHTADLIEKYSALPGPESIKNQESEKSPKEIIRIKREQGEEKQDSTYSIRSTDKVALEEFDLKSALFKHMNKNKTANRNPANYHLYHALMEALIADEDAMDKEVAVKVKDHKRKHDSDDEEDDDDDEGPSAGSNQGRSAKRRRPESAASGSAQPPSKDDHQSSKKPRESDASASIQHPALTSTGWQITDTRDDVVNSLMHMLPNNIQITDTTDVVSEHFDRDDNAGDDNEETKPDPEEIYNSGPAPSLMTPGYISLGLVQISVSPTPYVPPSKKDYEILL